MLFSDTIQNATVWQVEAAKQARKNRRSSDELTAAVIATKSASTRAMISVIWSNFWALE